MSETRVVNLRCEAYDVLIDRRTPFGNGYVLGRDGTRAEVVALHNGGLALRARQCSNAARGGGNAAPGWSGQRLGCHCKPLACHGDNYVTLIGELFGCDNPPLRAPTDSENNC